MTVKISIDNTTPLPDIAPISSISPGEWMFNFTPISEGLNGISHCYASENAACSSKDDRFTKPFNVRPSGCPACIVVCISFPFEYIP